jgi:hypothetical protein
MKIPGAWMDISERQSTGVELVELSDKVSSGLAEASEGCDRGLASPVSKVDGRFVSNLRLPFLMQRHLPIEISAR